ncbi:NirD/YgiW/YdeI family stress tolerance protein [Izhakiella australiensis]|nr:NirD/YgiW/YdeI family stress tolerance protein [Izhakiella australiensis]
MRRLTPAASFLALIFVSTGYAADAGTPAAPAPAYSNQADSAASNSHDESAQENNISEIKQLASLSEGSHVVIEGKISKKQSAEKYLIEDDSGTLTIVIPNQLQHPALKSGAKYRINGLLMKNNNDIWVQIEKLQSK